MQPTMPTRATPLAPVTVAVCSRVLLTPHSAEASERVPVTRCVCSLNLFKESQNLFVTCRLGRLALASRLTVVVAT